MIEFRNFQLFSLLCTRFECLTSCCNTISAQLLVSERLKNGKNIFFSLFYSLFVVVSDSMCATKESTNCNEKKKSLKSNIAPGCVYLLRKNQFFICESIIFFLLCALLNFATTAALSHTKATQKNRDRVIETLCRVS